MSGRGMGVRMHLQGRVGLRLREAVLRGRRLCLSPMTKWVVIPAFHLKRYFSMKWREQIMTSQKSFKNNFGRGAELALQALGCILQD